MFGKNKKQPSEPHLQVTFVQPHKGEAYFHARIAHASFMGQKETKQVFTDFDLSLAGKLKLIFEREKMSWFEVREEISTLKNEHFFTLYYYPQRLVEKRSSNRQESATLENIKSLFEYFITKDQTRLAEIQPIKSPTASGFIGEECEPVTVVAAAVPMEAQETLQILNPQVIDQLAKKRRTP